MHTHGTRIERFEARIAAATLVVDRGIHVGQGLLQGDCRLRHGHQNQHQHQHQPLTQPSHNHHQHQHPNTYSFTKSSKVQAALAGKLLLNVSAGLPSMTQ